MQESNIPYDKIDVSLRTVIRSLNAASLFTLASCAGHCENGKDGRGYIVFPITTNIKSIKTILNAHGIRPILFEKEYDGFPMPYLAVEFEPLEILR